jgi:hypothetical protein
VKHGLSADVAQALARFSTTNGCPMRSASRWATMRVAVSTPPPGDTLTMMRTGRLG